MQTLAPFLSVVGVTTFDFFRDTLKGMVEPFRHEDQIRRLIKEREAELSSEIDKSTTRSKTIIEDKHFFKARHGGDHTEKLVFTVQYGWGYSNNT